MVDALAEAEVVAGAVGADEEEAAALPHRMVADLEGADAAGDLPLRLRMASPEQLRQDQLLVLRKIRRRE